MTTATALSTTYVCDNCFSVLPFRAFWRKRDGTWSKCKSCLKARPRWEQAKRRRKNRRTYWEQIIERLRAEGCAICGSRNQPTFHHLNPRVKRFELNLSEIALHSYDQVAAELEKCCVLCYSCHMQLHQKAWKARRYFYLQPIRLDQLKT